MSGFILNEHGLWCPSCGECIAPGQLDEDFTEPDECRCCGYPDAEAVADYHVGDDEDCSNCGGEGVVYMCVEEFACVDPEGDTPIGRAVAGAMHDYWGRWHVRFSGAEHDFMAARVVEPGETDPDAILCPAQTGATDCCATCALCWQSDRSIAFRPH